MKKIILAAVLTLAFAVSAMAAAPAGPISLPAKNGNVAFKHDTHAKQDCKTCHGDAAPAKLGLDKDKAHKLCKDCHAEKKAGPTKCGECHKK
jgi:predicted CXXCH cytochrome family protein